MGLLDALVSSVVRGVLSDAQSRGLPDLLSSALRGTDLGSVGGLLQQLQQSGLDRQVASWLGQGANLPVSIDQLRQALGQGHLQQLSAAGGISIDDLLKILVQGLPGAVDQMSPDGNLHEPEPGADDAGAEDGERGGSLADQAGLNDIGRRRR